MIGGAPVTEPANIDRWFFLIGNVSSPRTNLCPFGFNKINERFSYFFLLKNHAQHAQ